MEDWKKEITSCSTKLELQERVSNLLKREKLSVLDQVWARLDRSDPGYARLVNALLQIKQQINGDTV